MSGGVDSSVSAYLMREKYKSCKGATMLLFLNEALGVSSKYPCCSRENIIDAKAVCDVLGIEHEILNFMNEFEECVIKKFVRVYETGGTPNPCIDCNKFIKFALFLEYARKSGLERIATGHYARIEYEGVSVARNSEPEGFSQIEYDVSGLERIARDEHDASRHEEFSCDAELDRISHDEHDVSAFMRTSQGEQNTSGLISRTPGRFLLRKAVDLSRDQSYVLYGMTQEQLSYTDFPLGSMKKSEVRELAGELGFVNARKHDSQDICFVPDGDYAGFIETYTGKKYPEGKFIDASGKVLGTHNGIIHYTAGQRRGLGVAAKSRLYISEINTETNTITLSPECLMTKRITVNDVNLIAFGELPENYSASVKVRYRQKEIPAVINQVSSDELVIEFHDEQKAPAIGQAAVIYDGDYVIGGGTIAGVAS